MLSVPFALYAKKAGNVKTYKIGDFVSLAAGSRHDSFSPNGCVIVVTHRGRVVDLEKGDL